MAEPAFKTYIDVKHARCAPWSYAPEYIASLLSSSEAYSYSLRRRGHYGCVNCLAFSPDGRYFVSGSDDERLLIWDSLDIRRQTPAVEIQPEHWTNIFSCSFDYSQTYLLSGGNDGRVIRTPIATPTMQNVCANASVACFQAEFLPGSSTVAVTAFDEGAIRLVDYRAKRGRMVTIYPTSNAVYGVSVRPVRLQAGQQIAYVSEDMAELLDARRLGHNHVFPLLFYQDVRGYRPLPPPSGEESDASYRTLSRQKNSTVTESSLRFRRSFSYRNPTDTHINIEEQREGPPALSSLLHNNEDASLSSDHCCMNNSDEESSSQHDSVFCYPTFSQSNSSIHSDEDQEEERSLVGPSGYSQSEDEADDETSLLTSSTETSHEVPESPRENRDGDRAALLRLRRGPYRGNAAEERRGNTSACFSPAFEETNAPVHRSPGDASDSDPLFLYLRSFFCNSNHGSARNRSRSRIPIAQLEQHAPTQLKRRITASHRNEFLTCNPSDEASTLEVNSNTQTPRGQVQQQLPLCSASESVASERDTTDPISDITSASFLQSLAPRPLRAANSLTFSHDGSFVLILCRRQNPLVFYVEDPRPMYELRSAGYVNSSTLKTGCWLPDDRHIAVGSENAQVHIWQLPHVIDICQHIEDGLTEVIYSCRRLSGHKSIVNCCASPPPYPAWKGLPFLATSGIEKMIRLWLPTDTEERLPDEADDLPEDGRFICERSCEDARVFNMFRVRSRDSLSPTSDESSDDEDYQLRSTDSLFPSR